jgi:hypothetical protein
MATNRCYSALLSNVFDVRNGSVVVERKVLLWVDDGGGGGGGVLGGFVWLSKGKSKSNAMAMSVELSR